MKIGDKAFFSFWENSRAVTSANQAKEVLEKVMAIAQMPLELTGNVSQTRSPNSSISLCDFCLPSTVGTRIFSSSK